MVCTTHNHFLVTYDLFQHRTCQSSLWIALCCPSAAPPWPPPRPPRPPALPAPPQDPRAPTLPALAPALPSPPRSTAPLPLPPQARRILGEWPRPSQAPPTQCSGQQACRAARLRMDPSRTRRVRGLWQKTDPQPTSLKFQLRRQRGRLPLLYKCCLVLSQLFLQTKALFSKPNEVY